MFAVKCLKSTDQDVIDMICLSLKTAYSPALSHYFIYQDPSYKNYFKTIVNDAAYFNYYCFNQYSGKLLGFACFKKTGRTLLLKNIIIDEHYLHKGLGSGLLFHALKRIVKKRPRQFDLFQLDVFRNNINALMWYLGIGMNISECTYWYDISDYFKQGDEAGTVNASGAVPAFELGTDQYGFTQLLYNHVQIGNLIPGKRLVIRTDLQNGLLEGIQYFFRNDPPVSACLVTQKKSLFPLIDKSFQMTILLQNLL